MIKVHASDYIIMKDLMKIILKFMICETEFFYYPLFGKTPGLATHSLSMKMVVMSSLHPLRWIIGDTYWYFGHSTFPKARITHSTFYIVHFTFFAHFKGYFGFHFPLNIEELPNNNR